MKDYTQVNFLRTLLNVFVIVLCGNVIGLRAQDNKFKEVIPPAPNAAALGRYGEIPVSYHTGVPNISIPIHTVTEGELSIPITVNYHASGIKVEEVSSWVGLGWSLNAGGMISRTVVGAPDEGTRAGNHSDLGFSGWYKDGGIPIGMTTCSHPNYTSGSLASSCLYRYQDAAHGEVDTEPDMFSFNFAGYSGTFFFNEFRQAIMQPRQDVVIQPSADFSTWTIIVPDGTKYTFGGSGATEKNYFGPVGIDNLSSTTWYLIKVENLNGTRWIQFNYVSEKYGYTVRPGQSVVFKSDGTWFNPGGAQGQGIDLAHAPQYASLTSVDGIRLSSITTSSFLESVNFIAQTLREDISKYGAQHVNNDEAKSLDRIVISNSTQQRTFEFEHSYFVSAASSSQPAFGETTQDRYRLKLNSIQEITEGEKKPPHEFIYNTSVTMARRLSLARDHWGYYNAADANTGLIPDFTLMSHTYTGLANRSVNESAMQACLLKEIKYPTGGRTEFIFEAHRQDATNLVGGLRIKQTKTYDGIEDVPMVKNYEYDFGILYAGAPNYIQSTSLHEYSEFTTPFLGTLVSSNIRSALRTTQGYHIGYSTVSVTDGVNGKSTYRYYNTVPMVDFYFPSAPTQSDLGMGELYQEQHADSTGTIVHWITNYFVSDFTRTINAKKVTSVSCVEGCATNCDGLLYCNEFVLVRNYQIKEGRRLLVMREELKDGVTTRTDYTYSPNHNQPTTTFTRLSNGKEAKITNDYVKDRYVSACSLNDSDCRTVYYNTLAVLRDQLNAGIALCEAYALNNCESSDEWTDDDCRTMADLGSRRWSCKHNCQMRVKSQCIKDDALWTTYEQGVKQAETAYLSCRSANIEAYNDCVEASVNSAILTDRSVAKMITGNVNALLEEKTTINQVQTKGSRTVYDFQGDMLLPSKFYEFDPQLQQWKNELTVKYDSKGNVAQTQKTDDHAIAYLWGYKQTLPIAKVVNCNISEIEETKNTLSNFGSTLVQGNQATFVTVASNILISFPQNVTLQCTVDRTGANPSIPNNYFNVILSLFNTDTQTDFGGTFGLTSTQSTIFTNIPAGNYSIRYKYLGNIGSDNPFHFTTGLAYQIKERITNAFYTSFEEDVQNIATTAYTGRKSHSGSYTFNLPRQVGEYILTYRTKQGSGFWQYQIENINIATTTPQTKTIGSGGILVDEVRLYPKGAQMTSYTYDSGVGTTTKTDENNITVFYEYDGLNRLKVIRDDKGNIVRRYKYHYATESVSQE